MKIWRNGVTVLIFQLTHRPFGGRDRWRRRGCWRCFFMDTYISGRILLENSYSRKLFRGILSEKFFPLVRFFLSSSWSRNRRRWIKIQPFSNRGIVQKKLLKTAIGSKFGTAAAAADATRTSWTSLFVGCHPPGQVSSLAKAPVGSAQVMCHHFVPGSSGLRQSCCPSTNHFVTVEHQQGDTHTQNYRNDYDDYDH